MYYNMKLLLLFPQSNFKWPGSWPDVRPVAIVYAQNITKNSYPIKLPIFI